MQLGRLVRHVAATHWRTRMRFPASTLDTIEQAIDRVEQLHSGEIRFAVETALTPWHVLQGISPRARALEAFAALRVWDTEHNNGVLIYVLLADRTVEIIADRGVARRVSQSEWDAVCRQMEEHFRAGRFRDGSVAGVEAVGTLLARHFPVVPGTPRPTRSELPDRPSLL